MKMLDIVRGLGLAFFCTLSVAQADEGLLVQWYTDAYSEPEPLATTLGDWGDEFGAGEHQWVVAELTLGYRFQHGLELSWQRRAQASTRINPAAASLYGRIQREEGLTAGEQTPLRLSVDSFAAHSLRIGYHRRWQSLQVTAGLSYLQTSHLTDGTLSGNFITQADNEYQVAADIDYVYYTDPVFNRPDIERASGQGIAVDLDVAWQLSDQWAVNIQGKDLLAHIEWKQAPHSVGEANTGRKQIGDDGYAQFNPLFSGRESYKDDHNQRIAPRLQAELTKEWGQWQLNTLWRRQFDVNHWGLGGGVDLNNGQHLAITAWPERKAVELTWRIARWQLGFHTDLRSWSNTQSLGLSLQYSPSTHQ